MNVSIKVVLLATCSAALAQSALAQVDGEARPAAVQPDAPAAEPAVLPAQPGAESSDAVLAPLEAPRSDTAPPASTAETPVSPTPAAPQAQALPVSPPPPGQAAGSSRAARVAKAKPKESTRASPLPRKGLLDDRLSGGFGAQLTWRDDQGYDLFAADDTFLGPLADLSVEIVRLPRRIGLAIDLQWNEEQARAKKLLGGQFTSAYDAHSMGLGAEARHYVTEYFYPHLRLWAGASATMLQLRNGTPGQVKTYKEPLQWTAIGGLGLGLSLRTSPLRVTKSEWVPQPSIGLRVEAGYMVGQPNTFRLRHKSAGSSAIPVRESSLGELERNAAYVQASAFLRL